MTKKGFMYSEGQIIVLCVCPKIPKGTSFQGSTRRALGQAIIFSHPTTSTDLKDTITEVQANFYLVHFSTFLCLAVLHASLHFTITGGH